MSAIKSLFSFTNIAYLVGAVYFIAVTALGESTSYSLAAAVLCLVSVPLSLKKEWFFSVPWRVATAAFVLVLFVVQIGEVSANATSTSGAASILINGALLLIFLGVLLSAIQDSVKKESEEEKEEEEKEEEQDKKKREAKKLTYEV